MDITAIVNRLLDMDPDPIPKFVLLKEFKGCSPDSVEYQNAYDRVCSHRFIRLLEESQNDKGFWPPFHGDTEGIIRLLLSYGLNKDHPCLKKVTKYMIKLLHGEEDFDSYEKQDNIRWWPEIFMPLVLSAMISLIDNTNENLIEHRKRWAGFVEISLKKGYYENEIIGRRQNENTNFFAKSAAVVESYDYEADKKAQNEYFNIKTTRIIHPFNYYNCLLLSPRNRIGYLSDKADQALVEYGINEAACLYYVYNRNPGELVHLSEQNRDSRSFCHWIRALSLISQFKGWDKHEHKYFEWVLSQRNSDGLWSFPKKYGLFALSDSWRGNNRAIDSTIYILRFLMKKQAF